MTLDIVKFALFKIRVGRGGLIWGPPLFFLLNPDLHLIYCVHTPNAPAFAARIWQIYPSPHSNTIVGSNAVSASLCILTQSAAVAVRFCNEFLGRHAIDKGIARERAVQRNENRPLGLNRLLSVSVIAKTFSIFISS